MSIRVGTPVTLTGLRNKPELNGLAAECVNIDHAKGHCIVRVTSTSETKKVRIDNCIPAPSRIGRSDLDAEEFGLVSGAPNIQEKSRCTIGGLIKWLCAFSCGVALLGALFYSPDGGEKARDCVSLAEVKSGVMVKQAYDILCWGPESPSSGTVVYHGEACEGRQIKWMVVQNPKPRAGLKASQCQWHRSPDAAWNEQWVGLCGVPPSQMPNLPTHICPDGEAPQAAPAVHDADEGGHDADLAEAEHIGKQQTKWPAVGPVKPAAQVPAPASPAPTPKPAASAPAAQAPAAVAPPSSMVPADETWELGEVYRKCPGTEFESPWKGTEGGLEVDAAGIRMHKAGCNAQGSHTAEAKKDVPPDAIGLELTFGVALACSTWCSPLWVTLYDKAQPDKFYRWCVNKRNWGPCDVESEVIIKKWHQKSFLFSCFEEKHGYKPKALTLGLGVYYGLVQGGVSTLIRGINFEVMAHAGGAVENVVLWAIDKNLENKKRMIESISGFAESRSKGNCNFPRMPVAYSVVAAGDEALSCMELQKLGLKVPCREVAAMPHNTPKLGCIAASAPELPFVEGLVHLIKLPASQWNPVFAKTIDAFSLAINKGQPKESKFSKRVELIYNRANHIRFISDLIFMPHGIKQVLYLDNDICPKAPVDEMLRTPGRAAVVAARKVDANGRPETRYIKENIRIGKDFTTRAAWKHGFVYSFNAGVVLLRTETMCEINLMRRLLQVQNYHNSVQRLWDKGTNQPPFEIAAASSMTMVPWYWNCRLLEHDIEMLSSKGVKRGSPVAWMKDCKLFHPSTHGKTIQERSCKMFDGLGNQKIDTSSASATCPFSVYMYDLPWPWDDLKPVTADAARKWPKMAAADKARNAKESGPLTKSFAFGAENKAESGVTVPKHPNALGNLIYYRLKHSRCLTANAGEADIFVVPMLLAQKTPEEWATKCAEILEHNGAKTLMERLKHWTPENANRHLLINVDNVGACKGWWAEPFVTELAQVQRASVHYCFKPPCGGMANPDPITSVGAIYQLPFPSSVHWSSSLSGEPPWARVRNRPFLMSLIMGSSQSNGLRTALWETCGKLGEPVCKQKSTTQMPSVAEEVYQIYSQSEFCLQPQGSTCERVGILDSLLLGCIPVLFSDDACPQRELWEMHWGSWQKDSSVIFAAKDVLSGKIDVRAELAKIPRRRRQHMRTAIRRYGHRLQYNVDDPAVDEPDALALLFRAIKYGRAAPPPPFYAEAMTQSSPPSKKQHPR